MSRRLEVIITPDGKTSIRTLGFTGSTCQQASRFLEEALGQTVTEHRTAEFYQAESVQQHQQERS
jgi:hypothetical protein